MATARNQDISFDDAMGVVKDLMKEIRFHRHGVHVAQPVLLAGSLGQQTAVPGDYDIDLVIYSDSINPLDVLSDGYERPLHKLRSHMGREWRVKVKKPPSTMSVNMRYESADIKIDVDILVSPNWGCPEDFYKFLTTAKTIHSATPAQMFRFSVNASKWQVDFILKQDDKARVLIRRAKAWKSKEWPEGKYCIGRPKSYLITLLVLRAYENAKDNLLSSASIEQRTTDELIEIVEDHLSANIYWTDYYETWDYPKLFPAVLPRIMDPANPANNLHETGIIAGGCTSYSYGLEHGEWAELVRRIDTIDLTKTIAQIQAEN